MCYWLTMRDCWSTVTLSLSDEDFGKMCSGKTQAQRLFMSGKLKVKGDVMKVRYWRDVRVGGYLLLIRMAGHEDGAGAQEGADEG